jgi:hypothetical protein
MRVLLSVPADEKGDLYFEFAPTVRTSLRNTSTAKRALNSLIGKSSDLIVYFQRRPTDIRGPRRPVML